MKKIISTCIICCMIFNVSLADSVGTATKGSDGVYSKTNSYNLKSVQDSDATSIITSYAIGALATKMLMYEKKTYDMYVALAGGATYATGAVMNVIQTKKELKDLNVEVTFRSDGQIDSSQVESIKKLKESWEKGRDSLNRLKSLQNIAMYGFLAASGVALVQRLREEGLKQNCFGAIETAQNSLAGLCSASASTDGGSCFECVARIGKFSAEMMGAEAKKIQIQSGASTSVQAESFMGPSRKRMMTEASTPCASPAAQGQKEIISAACNAYMGEEKLNSAFGILDAKSASLIEKQAFVFAKNENLFKKDFKKVLSYFIPFAEASYMELLGLTGGAATAFLTQKFAYGNYIDRYIWSPTGRIVAWGALAGLVKLAIGKTEDRIKDAEENIEKLNRILAETDRLTKGISASSALSQYTPNLSTTFAMNDVVLSGGKKTTCLDSDATANCSSSTSANLGTVSIEGLPTQLATASSNLIKTANSLSGTGTLSGNGINALNNSNLSAVGKYKKQLEEKLNAVLKANGKPTENFAKDEKRFTDGLNLASANALKKSNMSASQLLASIDPNFSANTTKSILDAPTLAATTSKAAPGTSEKDIKKIPNELSIKLDENNSGILADGQKEGNSSDKYDIKVDDVNHDKSTSIFEVISTRYQKSAFPKLLEEETKNPN